MKTNFILLFFCFTYSSIFAQLKKGYLVSSDNTRTEVLFSDTDFNDHTKIRYKISEADEFQKLDKSTIKEYGVEGDLKFVKRYVRHDLSYGTISPSKDPRLDYEELFLNVVLEGDINLYSYVQLGVSKFFYEHNDSARKTTQLVYKKYQLSKNSNLMENNLFRNQLFDILKCDDLDINDFKNLKYKKEDLIQVFKKHDVCKGVQSETYENKTQKKAKINVTGVASVSSSKFGVTYPTGSSTPSTSVTFGVGAELAIVLPSEKLEFFLLAEYEGVSATSRYIRGTGSTQENSTFEFKKGIINAQIGARHNFKINAKNKIFAQVAAGLSMPSSDVEYFETYPNAGLPPRLITLKTSTANFIAVGAGYTYNSKIGLGITYTTNRDFLSQNLTSTDFSRLALSLRYTIN